jgi:hypothetical protein
MEFIAHYSQVCRINGEYRLRMFGGWALRIIFGPNRNKVTGGWKTTA